MHKTILARYSGHARSLLSAIGEGTVAPSSTGEELAAALSAPLGDASTADTTAFLRLLYSLTSPKLLVEALCGIQRDAGEPRQPCLQPGGELAGRGVGWPAHHNHAHLAAPPKPCRWQAGGLLLLSGARPEACQGKGKHADGLGLEPCHARQRCPARPMPLPSARHHPQRIGSPAVPPL